MSDNTFIQKSDYNKDIKKYLKKSDYNTDIKKYLKKSDYNKDYKFLNNEVKRYYLDISSNVSKNYIQKNEVDDYLKKASQKIKSEVLKEIPASEDYTKAVDFVLGKNTSPERGPVGHARALVRDGGSSLTINYDNDFTGGVNIHAKGGLRVGGSVDASGFTVNGQPIGGGQIDFDMFSNGNDAKFSNGWNISGTGEWDPVIRGPNRTGFAHTENKDGLGPDWDDNITTNRTADIKVPDGMKSGFLFHLPWVSCRDFDIWGVLNDGEEVFIRRVNAYQNVRNGEKYGLHDGAAVVPIPRVDRFTYIRIKGVRGRIHYMGTGWTKNPLHSYASGADSGFVSSRNIIGSNVAFGDTPVPSDWTGANFKRRDGRWTHFDWRDNQRNYIRGDTVIDNTVGLQDNQLRLRDIDDGNHYLGFNKQVDGPRLQGHQGGQLGTNIGGDKTALVWNADGDVTVTRNASVGDNVIMSGDNSWILHTPDDGRKTFYIAPGKDGANWDWSKQTKFEPDGSVQFSNNIAIPSGKTLTIRDQYHGLSFADDMDGPALYGYGGGKLRVAGETPVDTLKWNRDGIDVKGKLCSDSECLNVKDLIKSVKKKIDSDMQFKENLTLSTEWNSEGSGNFIFLDRHNVSCPIGPLNKLRLVRKGDGNFRYDFGCAYSGATFGEEINKNSDWNVQENTMSLKNHDINCGDNAVISKLALGHDGAGKIRYSYSCLPTDKNLTLRTDNTEFNDNGGGNAIFLDRHNIQCKPNEALNRFKLVTDDENNKYRYDYTCASYPTNTIQIQGCESDPVTLKCDSGIKNASIKYGRWDNSICNHPTVNNDTAPVSKVYNLTTANNKSTYTMTSKNLDPNVNEDPLPGVYKHWKVNYDCI